MESLLSCIEKYKSMKACQLVVIGATGHLESLDPAFVSSWTYLICLKVLDVKSREEMLRSIGHGFPVDSEMDYASLAQQTTGFVASDLVRLVKKACEIAQSEISDDSKVR